MESQPDPASAATEGAKPSVVPASISNEMPTDIPANLSSELPADLATQLPVARMKGGLSALLAKIPGFRAGGLANFFRTLKNKIKLPKIGRKKADSGHGADATKTGATAGGQAVTGALSAVPDESTFVGKVKINSAYLVTSVVHRDRLTRFSTWMFWLSLVGLGVVGTVGLNSFRDLLKKRGPNAQELAAKAFLERTQRREEIDRVLERSYEIGGFSIQLVEPKGAKIPAGLMNIVELEVVVESDSPDTKRSLELRPQKAKDQVTRALTPLDRDDLLTGEGKKRLKHAIMDQLNGWLTQGHVTNVFFQKILIE